MAYSLISVKGRRRAYRRAMRRAGVSRTKRRRVMRFWRKSNRRCR